MTRHDYLPFGEELAAGVAARTAALGYGGHGGMRQRFTSKERDDETGLDSFGARYYSGTQGRFTSVDPSYQSAHTMNPQSWNRYAYCLNNPSALVDRNGKWPEPTHRSLVDEAFPGLTAEEREAIHQGSRDTDAIIGVIPVTLLPNEAHKHSMRQEGEPAWVAELKMAAFIVDRFGAAQDAQSKHEAAGGQGLSGGALYNFGELAHPVMDSTSPEHIGPDGMKEYKIDSPSEIGIPSWATPADVIAATIGVYVQSQTAHAKGEGASRPPTPEEREKAVFQMKQWFRHTFGEQQFNRAITPPPPPPKPAPVPTSTTR